MRRLRSTSSLTFLATAFLARTNEIVTSFRPSLRQQSLTGAKRTPKRRTRTILEALSSKPASMTDETPVVEDGGIWDSYAAAVVEIMKNKRVSKTRVDVEPVQDYLLSNSIIVPPPRLPCEGRNGVAGDRIGDMKPEAADYREILSTQRENFLNATGFNREQFEYLTRCLTYLGDHSAKRRMPYPAAVAWKKILECGMAPRENCISTYMYVLGLLPPPKTTTTSTTKTTTDYSVQVATVHDLMFEPNEKTVTLRIKSLVANGDAEGAEALLESLPDKRKNGGGAEWKRLRTFQPILSYYCENDGGDMASALRLFHQMRQSDGVFLDAETYCLIISSLARRGCFRKDAEPIQGVSCGGPDLFDRVARAMADDLLELTQETAKTLHDAFCAGFGTNPDAAERITEDVAVDHSDTVPACRQVNDQLLIGRVEINQTTGECPETGATLRLFALTQEQRRHVHDTLLEMAASQHEEHCAKTRAKGKLNEGQDGDFALQELSSFSAWLNNREGEPFTAFVDGPNVAYFGHGNVHYSQVQLVIDELERMGERPLVTMPQKYVQSSFWVSGPKMQVLSQREIDIMNNLLETGRMFTVPAACLDDYYWMLASVANQTESRLYVATDNRDGRFPGMRPILVTNDNMRDHRLSLLEPREFRRWKSCHVVNYAIGAYESTEWESRNLSLFPADFFSREMQGNSHPGYAGATVWHFPVVEWDEPGRLLIFIQH